MICDHHNRPTPDGCMRCTHEAAIQRLLERIHAFEKAHAWFVNNTEYYITSLSEDACPCGAWPGGTRHAQECEWVMARDLKL